MNKYITKRSLLVILTVSILLNFYTIKNLLSMNSKLNDFKESNISEIYGSINVYGTESKRFLNDEDFFSHLHLVVTTQRLAILRENIHRINESIKIDKSNDKVVLAVSDVGRAVMNLESFHGFHNFRVDGIRRSIVDSFDEEYVVFLHNFADEIIVFSDKVNIYYQLIDKETTGAVRYKDYSYNKTDIDKLITEITEKAESIKNLLPWF